jgi:hypothetical protein
MNKAIIKIFKDIIRRKQSIIIHQIKRPIRALNWLTYGPLIVPRPSVKKIIKIVK